MSSSNHVPSAPEPDWVQVNFRMSGGPATSMGVPAEELSSDRVRLHWAPWSTHDAAKGDVFRVRRDADGALWAEEKLEASGWCTIGLALTQEEPPVPFEVQIDTILGKFAPLGVTGSGMFGYAVVDVRPEADLAAVRRLLDEGYREGWWEYDELCVTDAWKAAAAT